MAENKPNVDYFSGK